MRAAALHELMPPLGGTSPTKRRSDALFSIGLLAVAIGLIAAARQFAPAEIRQWFGSMPFETPVDLVLLVGACLAAVAVHEAGHLVASLGFGFRVLGMTLGPLQIQMLHGTWKWWWRRDSFFKGSVTAMPESLRYWRAAMMTVVAFGPLATLAGMVGAATMATSGHAEVVFQTAFVQVSALLFLLGLIPTPKQARKPNDMRLLIDLARRNEGGEEMELNVLLAQQVIAGSRPQDYPDELIARLAAWRGRPESQLAFAQAMVRWALDSGHLALADGWDSRALALSAECGGRMQNAAAASSACMDILLRDDAACAREKFEGVDFGALFPRCFELRARAAQELAAGHAQQVGRYVIRAQYAIPRGVGAYGLERDLLERLHLRALAAMGGTRARAASV